MRTLKFAELVQSSIAKTWYMRKLGPGPISYPVAFPHPNLSCTLVSMQIQVQTQLLRSYPFQTFASTIPSTRVALFVLCTRLNPAPSLRPRNLFLLLPACPLFPSVLSLYSGHLSTATRHRMTASLPGCVPASRTSRGQKPGSEACASDGSLRAEHAIHTHEWPRVK